MAIQAINTVNQLPENVNKAADDFIKGIHEGTITRNKLHYGLMGETANNLVNSVMESFNIGSSYDSPQWGLTDYIQNNIFAFSGAKTLTEFELFSQSLIDEKGNIRSYSDFKKQVEKINLRYNELYLEIERESAIAQAQNAEIWHSIEENREAGEEVEYRTAGDGKVRDSHQALNGMIFHIDDPVLDTISPQNDWGCRCRLVQVDKPQEHTPEDKVLQAVKNADVPAYFKNNPGRSGMIYDEGHPYFKTIGINKLQQLSAVKNYGMKQPETIYARADKLPLKNSPFDNVNQFKAWWGTKVMAEGKQAENSFMIASKKLNNLPVVLDNDLHQRFVSGKYYKEARYELATNIENIITDPDEVWTTFKGKSKGKAELLTGYIKYYNETPMIIVTRTVRDNGFGYVRMVSLHELNVNSLKDWRRGILRYKKN